MSSLSIRPAAFLLPWIVLSALGAPVPAEADADRPQLLGEIRAHLDAGEWQEAAKRVRKAEKKILHRDEVRISDRRDLAELALYRAVAAANLDRDDEARWFWHLAHGLDLATARRDVSAWGRAAGVFGGIRVRDVGRLPEDAEDEAFTRFYARGYEPPEPPVLRVPGSLSQSHRVWDSEPVRVELYLDADGRPRSPRLIGRPAHPMLVYELFREYFDEEWEPARFEGEPVGGLFESVRDAGDQGRWH